MSASMVVEFSSPVSTHTQVMMYWVKGRMEKGGGHETRAVLEVMVSTIALGGSGTPVRGRGGKEEVGAKERGRVEKGREGGGRGRQRGRREGDDYMSQLNQILAH